MEQQIRPYIEEPQEQSHHEGPHQFEDRKKMEKTKNGKYRFETFSFEGSGFDSKFSEFLNTKYKDGWKYEDCQFYHEGSTTNACCIFERD